MSGIEELDIRQDIQTLSSDDCIPQKAAAETTMIENTNSVSDVLPSEGTTEENETKNFGQGKDVPNSAKELESKETLRSEGDFEQVSSLCTVEGAVVTSSGEPLVVSAPDLCGAPVSEPCQDTTSNDESTLNQFSEIVPVGTEEKVDTADSEMDVDLEHNSARKKTEALHEEVADVADSDIVFDSNLSHISNMDPVEPIMSVQNVNSMNDHRGAVVPYSDTEDSDSSSSTSSCVDSSDESSDSESSSSDSENEVSNTTPVKKSNSSATKTKDKSELGIEDLPPIQDLHISVRNDEVVEIGRVLHAVDTLVVVEGLKDLPPLDIDSVLFLDRGARPLGRVFDVMGPVTEPLYCVRFNSKEHIEEHNIQSGMLVYCAPKTEHSNFVFLQHLLMMKGSDASWKQDSEVPLECLDFSDDEEEAKLKKMQRAKKSEQSRNSDGPKPKASRVGNQSSHLLSSNQQSGRQNAGRNDGFRPRNPWSWSGARTQDSRNQNGAQPHRQEPSHSRGSVRPSSFTSDFSHLQSPRNYESGPFRYPQTSQFGQVSDPRMFGQPPTTHVNNTNAEWCSTAQQPHTQHNNAYPAMNSGSYSSFQHEGYQYPSVNYNPAPGTQCSGANAEDQRYHAFQSEIARLVDAYNRGAEAPSTAPSVHFNAGQAVRPQFPTLRPPGGEPASIGPPSFHANRLPFPSRLPPPSQRPPGPNFSYPNYYSGQW